MRISSTQYHSTMNTALQLANERAGAVLQQMATGNRLLKPSDDPIAQVRLMRLGREEAALDQYRKNIETLTSHLQQNEAYLDGIVNDTMQVRDLLVWALDGANVPQDLNAMATSIDSLRESILYTANSRDQEGRYVFSGTMTDMPAITYDPLQPLGSRYSFTGNVGQQLVTVGNGVTQPANISLPEAAPLLNLLDRVYATLSTPSVNVNDPVMRAELTISLVGMDTALDSVNAQIARLGGRSNILQTLDDTHANVSLSNQNAAITIGQLDYGDAAVKLNGYTTAVQATQKAYAKVSNLSLFDVL
ncbi:flagellar hook-associated protein FlgL [Ramlibacter sp. H39-3-26]|uniref:flagellar hook-associated protein FlgL n=1 Tax=Curvibacter soli TaxID=3031331 RepID=UPI0023DA7CF3|nr:flagellar hook-associated protein FlgL [Ramlibacter sp. H39-3-26]MDF1484193.1 flagellar hook-associated protein FlgL [Ramlibacter sp. H39-3-26]